MGITKENGDIFLLDIDGQQQKVASIEHGISFSSTEKTRKVCMVTIYSAGGELADRYFFAPGNEHWELVFQHIMTRDVRPELFRAILVYFADEKHYSPVSFVDQVIERYFMKELRYEFPKKKEQKNYA